MSDIEKREQRFGNRDGTSTRGTNQSQSQTRSSNFDGGHNGSVGTSQQQNRSGDSFKDSNDNRRDLNKGSRRA